MTGEEAEAARVTHSRKASAPEVPDADSPTRVEEAEEEVNKYLLEKIPELPFVKISHLILSSNHRWRKRRQRWR